MLWDAGQQRVARESRERLTELYVGVRDGYVSGNVAIGKAEAQRDTTPAYARGQRVTPSAEAQRATLARLGAMFPGSIARGDS
jgi:hypothetical protein